MIAKLAILFFAGACLAFPTDEEPRPTNVAAPILPPQSIPPAQDLPQVIPVPSPQGFQPEGQLQDGPAPPQGPTGGKPEDSDLKTENSIWYHRRSYPVVTYYRPRSYSYYYTPYYYWW